MPAFRFFDPWAALGNANAPTSPAKVANPANVKAGIPPALATLATLAEARVDLASLNELAETASSTVNSVVPPWGDAEEERAAIVEYDAGIPRAWAEGFARLDPNRPPADMPLRRWQRFLDDAGRFLDSPFSAIAASLGWTAYDLFGCDRDRPFARIDQEGLIWLLDGGQFVMLADNTATIESRTGARQTWRRKPSEPGRVLAWRLVT